MLKIGRFCNTTPGFFSCRRLYLLLPVFTGMPTHSYLHSTLRPSLPKKGGRKDWNVWRGANAKQKFLCRTWKHAPHRPCSSFSFYFSSFKCLWWLLYNIRLYLQHSFQKKKNKVERVHWQTGITVCPHIEKDNGDKHLSISCKQWHNPLAISIWCFSAEETKRPHPEVNWPTYLTRLIGSYRLYIYHHKKHSSALNLTVNCLFSIFWSWTILP